MRTGSAIEQGLPGQGALTAGAGRGNRSRDIQLGKRRLILPDRPGWRDLAAIMDRFLEVAFPEAIERRAIENSVSVDPIMDVRLEGAALAAPGWRRPRRSR